MCQADVFEKGLICEANPKKFNLWYQTERKEILTLGHFGQYGGSDRVP